MGTIYLTIAICLYTFALAMMQLDSIKSRHRWQSLRQKLGWATREDKLELALRDFVVAYDNQDPEQLQLLGAYLQAGDVLQEVKAHER